MSNIHREIFHRLPKELKKIVYSHAKTIVDKYKRSPEKIINLFKRVFRKEYIENAKNPEDMYVFLILKFSLSDMYENNIKEYQAKKILRMFRSWGLSDGEILSMIERNGIYMVEDAKEDAEIKLYKDIIEVSKKDEILENLPEFESKTRKMLSYIRNYNVIKKCDKRIEEILNSNKYNYLS